MSGIDYFIEYKDNDSQPWAQVQQDNDGIPGADFATSWKDDGSQISLRFDNIGVRKRLYRVLFNN